MRRIWLKPWIFLVLLTSLGTTACSGDGDCVVLFSVEDDKAICQKVAAQTDSTYRASRQLLERNATANLRAYVLLDGVVNKVLSSNQLQYRNEFPWDVKIIKNDEIQNAFATPGGHIYVFTGLIKFLETEDQLAGVLGHEIAHADRRHTSRALQKEFGISFLLSLLLGENPNQLAQIATSLGQLRFSREYEVEADDYSVRYLNGTPYACDGAAGFFIKSAAQAPTSTPEFLSTHPNPGSRVEAIQAKAKELNCAGRPTDNAGFVELQRLL
jgi:predicted Zn-dependent protease